MYDFGAFCYLDVQKTGSSFIANTLKSVSKRTVIAASKHFSVENLTLRHGRRILRDWRTYPNPRGGMYRRECFYFNSVRNPFSFYASLYNFGCDGRGTLAHRLHNAGFGDLYDATPDGFLRWTGFVLDPKNAGYLNAEYARTCAASIGFLSFRFLRLSVASPKSKLRALQTSADAQALYQRHGICRFTVRTESLGHDLSRLFQNELKDHVDVDAISQLKAAPKTNTSQCQAALGTMLQNSSQAAQVLGREALIFDNFYSAGAV